MLVVSSISELKDAGLDQISLACGNFDGIHLGHRKIIENLLLVSEASDSEPVVLTFIPHPREVLTGQKLPHLASMKTKIRLLGQLGVKAIVNIDFTEEFATNSADSFVKSVLQADGLRVCNICVGSDWHFGAKREGDVNFLRRAEYLFEVHPVEEKLQAGSFISSSRIRAALAQNDFTHARDLLGRDYSVTGEVVKGRGIASKQLNFATANLDVQQQFLPVAGVFVCQVTIGSDSKIYDAVCNVGSTPTFSNSAELIKVEVHLLDYTGNLYGLELEIFFKQFLRAERKFVNVQDLKDQIVQDVIAAREIFSRI
jgi:riboflavin kinase / FMN adenylyltransferase